MSTYWNGSIFQDDSFIPNYTSFNTGSNYFVQSSWTHSDTGSLNYISTTVSDVNFQIQSTGTYFLLQSSNKFLTLPNPNSTMTYQDGSAAPGNIQGNRFLIISDIGSISTHIINTIDNTKINGVPQITIQPKQTIQLIFNGNQWQIISAYPNSNLVNVTAGSETRTYIKKIKNGNVFDFVHYEIDISNKLYSSTLWDSESNNIIPKICSNLS